MGLSAREAAKEAGKAVTTITRAIDSGKLSAARLDGGGYSIEPAELFRVFPRKSSATTEKLHDATPKDTSENKAIERLVEKLEEQVADLRRDRDKWQEQAERLTLMLPAPDTSQKGQGSLLSSFGTWLRGKTSSKG